MFSRLFRSRWAALLWSAGVVWTAYDIAADNPVLPPRHAVVDATGEQVDAADIAAVANAATD